MFKPLHLFTENLTLLMSLSWSCDTLQVFALPRKASTPKRERPLRACAQPLRRSQMWTFCAWQPRMACSRQMMWKLPRGLGPKDAQVQRPCQPQMLTAAVPADQGISVQTAGMGKVRAMCRCSCISSGCLFCFFCWGRESQDGSVPQLDSKSSRKSSLAACKSHSNHSISQIW